MIYFKRYGGGYQGESSIFDDIKEDDLVMAFFPCTRFSALNMIVFSEKAVNYRTLDRIDILKRCMDYNKEQSDLYQYISELFILAITRKFKMIVENPYIQPHFLTMYFPIRPSLIDKDRRLLGDLYCKPTQYWFLNCEPKNNQISRDITFNFGYRNKNKNEDKIMETPRGIRRSLIEPKYAENFIKKYILTKEELRNLEEVF